MGYEFVDDEENKGAVANGYEFTDEPDEFTDEPEGRPQGESPIPLVSAGEAKAKGELGITETAQKDYEAATGVEAPKNPILAQIANMGLTVGGRLNANLQMQAAQKLAAGGNYTDRDMDDLMDQMVYGGVKKVNDAMETVPSVVGPGAEMAMFFHRKARQKQEPRPNEIMRDWDETEGKRYADPEERRIARMQYAGQIATDFIKERTAVKENATTELENREVTHTANIVSRGLGMLGYTAPYMLGPVGIGLQFLEEGSANAVGYANDEYGYDNEGRFRLVAEGDDAGRAALSGFGTAGIETATEIVGGKIGGALAKRGGKALGKLVVGNKAAEAIGAGVGKIAGKTAETLGKTKVGRATLAFAKGVGSTFKWTSKKMHLENPIEENIEEFESQQANSLLGWDRRKSELENLTDEDGNPIDGVAARWWHDTKQFLKPSEIVKLNEAMLLTMGGGAAVAHFANRSARKDVDNIIRKHNLMSEEEIKTTSLEDKVNAFNAWADGLNEEQTARMIDEGTGIADRLAERIAGDYKANRKRVNALREKMAERDDYNNGLELDRLQIPRQKFNIPMREDERGRSVPDFKTVFTIDIETGESAQRKAVYDESGISIVDNGGEGDAAYSVFSPDGKASRDFPTLTQAVRFATQIKNAYALDSARDGMKQQFIANEYEANYKGAKNQVIDVKSVDEAVKVGINMTGEDVSTDANFRPSRKGWRLKDGTVILVRDNINSPVEVQRLMRHEIVGHSDGMMQNRWFEADEKSEIGKLRGANLEKTMKDGPVRESATRRALRETVANVVQQRRHSADTIDKVVHAVRNALRDRGINLKMNDTDLEVEVSRIENELRNGEGKTHTSIDGTIEKQEFREVEQSETETQTETPTETEEVNEAGNESHEEPAQPEQDAQGGQEAAEAGQAAEVKPAEAEKPVSSRSVIEKMTDKTPVEEIPVSEVFNDDTRIPNFKEGANPETGEVEPLTGEPYDLVSNPIVVMEFKDGKKVVVTGRHRLALYKRSGRDKIAARVIREADGWTVDDARMIDSIGNIIDEKGTVKDYVKYFEDAKPSRAAAESGGFLARPKGKLAFGIYEGASEDTRSAIDWEGGGADGLISPEQAGIIAEAVPKNAHPRFGAVQKILVAKAKNGLRGKKLGILARSLAEEVKKQKETVHTGDMMQLDLFTSPEDLAFLAMEEKRADYRTRKSQEYGRIAEVLRTALSKGGKLDLNKEYARELGITDAKDKKQLAAARDKAVERANYWENAVQLDEADKAAMDAEIEASVKKADAKRADVAERLKAAKEGKPKPKTEVVGETAAQTSEKAPTSVPKKAEATAPTEAKKPAEGEKTPDSAKEEKKSASKSEKPPKKRTVTMKNAEEEKRVKALLDDITFDSPELGIDRGEESTVVSGDEVRKTMPGYNRLDWSTHVDRTGYVAPRLEAQFQRLLKERKGKGDGNVVFLAGGNGAGKSTVAAKLGATPDFTIDSTLGNLEVAKKQIDAILANGQTPVIHFVYRTTGQALEGIKNRVKNGGHIVSPLSFANSHVKSRENLRLLSKAYGDKIHLHIYDNSVDGAPEITLEQLEAKGKPDHERIRKAANYYLGHLRGREEGSEYREGGVARGGAESPRGQVDFESSEFDYEKFGRLVTGVGKLVDALAENGHSTFESLARYVNEVDAAKFERAKPVLQDVWNAVARQRKLARVSDDEAERVFGIIEAQTEKEASDENDGGRIRQVLRRIRGELPGEEPRAGGDSRVGVVGDESAAGKGSRSGGVLAGGSVRGEDSGQGVDGERPGVLHGRPEGLADEGTAQGVRIRDAGREASDGDESVGHQGVAEGGERPASGDRAGDGDNAGADASAGRGRRVKRTAAKAAKETKVAPARPDFVMTKAVEDAILEPNKTKRVENNLAAIRLVLKGGLNERGATPEEQETLAKYVGWGGLSEIFDYNYESAWMSEKSGDSQRALDRAARAPMGKRGWELYKELRGLLNDEMFASARASSTTAFYTPIEMVRAEHAALRALGLKGGRFLGPSAGVGNYASAAGEYQNAVNWQFVEKDAISGLILKALFPNQRVNVMGFEETKFPDGFFDLAIDNVPYADVSITDKGLSASRFLIHDYFFAKTLSKLRPGGVMMFLTSTGTLDKGSGTLRKFLAEHSGRIVGAVRLPNGFFSQNANTEAAADLVIIQRVEGKVDNSAFEGQHPFAYEEEERWDRKKGKWVTDKTPLSYNKYFADHPEQVIGKMEAANGQFGKTLRYTMPGADDLWGKFGLVRQAIDRALAGIDKGAFLNAATVAEKPTHEPVYDDEGLRQGNISVKDGKVYIKSGDMLEPVEMLTDRKLKKELAKRLRTPKDVMDGVVKLRKALRAVVDAEMRGCTDEELKPLLAALNTEYDRFVAKNGSLHDKWVTPFVLLDKADGNRLLALERVGKDATLSKADIFTKRVISIGAKAQKADTPKEALIVCYSENGTIVPERIGELLGVNAEDAVKQLKESGDAFENPQTGRIEPSWEYLSGHVRSKLAAARAAVEAGDESFRANVAALEKVQPTDVKLEDVEIKFGAPWVDPEAMKDFLRDAFGSSQMNATLKKSELTGAWEIELGARYKSRIVNNDSPWGRTTWDVTDFLQRVLNHASLESIYTDPVTKQKWRDEAETEANKLAAEKLHRSFGQFLRESEKWADASLRRYNDVNNDNVSIRLPENVMPFKAAGMSDGAMRMLFEDGDPAKPKKGREYQSQVIARGVLGGSSLCLAHCVGAGKTMEMQSIGMLGRHLGMFRKSMYVVPNHMLNQFCNEFIEAFPNANILRMTEEDVKPANRRAFFAQVADGDWDAIVVKHSTFSKKLGMSAAYQKQYAEERMKDLDLAIGELREQGDRISVKKAEKMKARLAENLKKLQDSEGKDAQIVPFEELGVDQLFVDEAHNFKGLEITTRQGRVGGLQQGDSQRATDMEMKCEYVQSLHGGDRGVVFATGTPLSNAPAVESYVMLRYLAPKALKEQGLWHFDDFIDSFGRITTETEFGVDGKTPKEKDKISAFVNIPELMRLFKSRVDIVNADQLDIPRPKPKYHMIDVEMTPVQAAVMEAVSEQAKTPGGKEWPSKYMDMTWVAKYACISPRMLGFTDGGNKIPRVVSEVKEVYDATSGNKGAQLIFTDRFQSGYELAAGRVLGGRDIGARSGIAYNLNEEIKAMLVQQGILESEIAIIQDLDKMKGDKDQNKEDLFEKVRNGEVRVLIGSRAKMGEGTNVQKRLAAIHLLHPGWKPSEDEQAIGRIIRFGNEYPEGQIFYYLTKGNANIGSYETKNHELIGVKSRLIQQVMRSDDTLRTIEIDESAMDRDMLMGLASGNKALLELIGVRKNTRKLELNAESTATSARRMKDKSEMNARAIAREREEWKETKAGIERWHKANDGKDFALTTTDGRSLEKAKDIADLVCAEVVKGLTMDNWERYRHGPFALGDFNGVPLTLVWNDAEEKFYLNVRDLGVARKVNNVGFVPDFSPQAFGAFKAELLRAVDPDYAKNVEAGFADRERMAKKQEADAVRLYKEAEELCKELVASRKRQAQLEREVTPLLVKTTADHGAVAYGDWAIRRSPTGAVYVAKKANGGAEVRAATVKALLPKLDEYDFGNPATAAKKTADLPRSVLGEDGTFETLKVENVDFMSTEFDGQKNGIIGNRERERRIVAALASGALRYPKFKPAEVAATQGEQHERLWQYITSLSVESTDLHPGRAGEGAEVHGRHDGSGSKGTRSFGWLGSRYEESPFEKFGTNLKYLDAGQESRVYDLGNGEVVKVRKARFFDKNGLIDILANIVYHNYLFPNDAYSLERIARYEHDGYQEFYLILRQPKVEPLKTANGFIVEPSIGQIMEALNTSPMRFSFVYDGHSSVDDEFDSSDSSDGDDGGEVVDVAKYKAYNGDFLVFDFQPGRNTFIDAKTGKVRFIDPRIMLNNPEENFSAASRFGKRKPYDKPLRINTDFMSEELSPEAASYSQSEDKTPTEEVSRKVFGMTNEDIATEMRAAGLEPPAGKRKSDDELRQQAEVLLSRPDYVAKLSRAVYKFGRPLRDYETIALGELFYVRQKKVNDLQDILNDLEATPAEQAAVDPELAQMAKEARKELKEARQLLYETGVAKRQGASEQGRALRSNRMKLDRNDFSFAGISNTIAEAAGGADKITPEMEAKIKSLADDFAQLDGEGQEILSARLKAFSEKVVNEIKNRERAYGAAESKPGNEGKRVMRNYFDAMAQVEVHANEVGDTLIGLADQMYPSWGKWLKAIGEYHCYMNPEITEEAVVKAITDDVRKFVADVDENQIRDMLTGFGHSFRQSRYDSQRLMNDLRAQARMKRQLDWMNERNELPPATGMVRDELSLEARQLAREVQERKKEVDETLVGANRLKGALQSAKTRIKNRIEELEAAIESGERIVRVVRPAAEDAELRDLKSRRDSLQAVYDSIFGTKRGKTEEQRVKAVEQALSRELEKTIEDLARARSGDFSKRAKLGRVTSATADALRQKIAETKDLILELKRAAYEFGLTPEEIAKRNAQKINAREAAIMRIAERIERGDLRTNKKPQPPMPPEMQKRYDEMGRQLKKAHQRLADMRLEAENETVPTFWRKTKEYASFVTAAQRALRATLDFSATLRQAARLTLGHPLKAASSFAKSWTAMKSEASLQAVNDEIMSDPSVQEAVSKYGLHLREVDAESARDVEMFHGMERNRVRLFGKDVAITDIPFFGELMLKSERHYLTYLNAMSAELYCSIVNDKTRFPGGATPWKKKMVCDMINIWNGSGAISKERRQALQKAWVNEVFWAPGLAISRIQSAVGYDIWRPLVAKGVKNADGGYDAVSAEERKTMAKIGASEHLKSSLAMLAIGALLKFIFGSDDDWYKFNQSDWFEKLLLLASPNVGNTTIDLTGGEASVYRLIHTIATGKKKSTSGRTMVLGETFGAPSHMQILRRFLEGKLSPWLSETVAIISGRDYTGEKYTLGKALVDSTIPLTLTDVYEQVDQNGIGKSLVTIPLALLGAGGSTYDRKPYENAINPFLESVKEYNAVENDDLLDEQEKARLLDNIRASNPLMRDDVREDIAADIKWIRKDEARVKKDEKNGFEPDADLLSEIEQNKAKLLEKVRAARRK